MDSMILQQIYYDQCRFYVHRKVSSYYRVKSKKTTKATTNRDGGSSWQRNSIYSAPTTSGLDRAQQSITSELHAVLFCIGLGTYDYHRDPIVVSLLHDIDRVIESHSRDHLHQDLDYILPLVEVVIVEEDPIRWCCLS